MTSHINIMQHGKDGVGHQLHGLLTCLALHDIGNYYFDAYKFTEKTFLFEHIDHLESSIVKGYFIEIAKCFIEMYNLSKKEYKKQIHAHEIYKIPKNHDPDTLYTLDNCFFFLKIPIHSCELNKYKENINKIKSIFINEKLPKNRLCKDNIVVHLRQGDAMVGYRGKLIRKSNERLTHVVPKLINTYPNHTFYIHTNGDPSFLTSLLQHYNVEYHVFMRKECILNVMSDFIYSKIFISCHSSLSTLCTFLGERELNIVPDDVEHSLPQNTIKMSDYV